jgi:hypothetical protein
MNNLILTLDIDWAPDFMIDFVAERQGVQVFNFHPVHVFLNSPDMNNYRQYQQQGMKPGPEASRADAEKYVLPLRYAKRYRILWIWIMWLYLCCENNHDLFCRALFRLRRDR